MEWMDGDGDEEGMGGEREEMILGGSLIFVRKIGDGD